MNIFRDTPKNREVGAYAKKYAETIKKTFTNFEVFVDIEEVIIGPHSFNFKLSLTKPVRMRVIQSFEDDLKLALECTQVDIEAPIPGTPFVGITIPLGIEPPLFSINDALKDEVFLYGTDLTIPVGKAMDGESELLDIARAPHMLISGSSGSGKTVFLQTVVNSLMTKNNPDRLRFIFMDPKRCELSLYNNLPHNLTPVLTDPKRGLVALRWVVKEIERRLDIIFSYHEKSGNSINIASYHQNILGNKKYEKENPEPMPYIVVIVDELADCMLMYPKEYESVIVQIAQRGRIAGIHLILSTTRPSVQVITGLIKSHIPTRIAFKVPSQVESRVILDVTGAEKLYGKGDMLVFPPDFDKPLRLQSYWISFDEVAENVKKQIKKYGELNIEESSNLKSVYRGTEKDVFSSDADDDYLYENAREAVIKAGKASTSFIQRKLRIGYSRAAALMDMLEERGVIGPAEGSLSRKVIGDDKK